MVVCDGGSRPTPIPIEPVTGSVVESVNAKKSTPYSGNLPYNGEPGTDKTLYNPDGTPKQKRWYGPDGTPERDRDYNHEGDMQFPHDHDWEDGKRGKKHLPPSPDYKICIDPVIKIFQGEGSSIGGHGETSILDYAAIGAGAFAGGALAGGAFAGGAFGVGAFGGRGVGMYNPSLSYIN